MHAELCGQEVKEEAKEAKEGHKNCGREGGKEISTMDGEDHKIS